MFTSINKPVIKKKKKGGHTQTNFIFSSLRQRIRIRISSTSIRVCKLVSVCASGICIFGLDGFSYQCAAKLLQNKNYRCTA